jgi:hypothetical protein
MTRQLPPLLWAILLAVATRAAAQLPAPVIPPIATPDSTDASPVVAPAPAAPAPAVTTTLPAPAVEGDGSPPARRDPFWPVGYRPEKPATSVAPGETAPPAPPPQPTEWERARKLLKITGISVVPGPKGTAGRKYAAIVGGRLVEEGDVVSKALNGFTYRWRVQSIGPTGVKLQQVDSREP